MDWNRAKNIILSLLIILNAVLFALIQYNSSQYKLRPSQETAIHTVMRNNGVGLYTELIKNSKPMRQLEIQQEEYDYDRLVEIFFELPGKVNRTDEYNRKIFDGENESMIVQYGIAVYKNLENVSSVPASFADAERLSKAFLKKVDIGKSKFIADRQTEITEDGFLLKYYQEFKGFTIASNYFYFWVTDKGISQIEFMYQDPVSFTGPMREICSADEALFTCMLEIKNIYGDNYATIDRMDLIYYQPENTYDRNIRVKISPYYRIFVSLADTPFFINAYTNQMS